MTRQRLQRSEPMNRRTDNSPLARRLGALALSALLVAVGCGEETTTPPAAPPPPPTPPPAPEAPAAPTNVSASMSGADVVVSWNGEGETYSVERQAVGHGFVELASGISSTSHTDAGVPDGTYNYRVFALSGGLKSAASETALIQVSRTASLTGKIEAGMVRELSADTTYLIRGLVTVEEGGTLRIPAGTLLQGDVRTQPSALMVRTGGMLFSEGTAEAPVVFTSSSPAGERRAGDWGGVVINGRSFCNFPEGECVGEGSSGSYGGSDVDDNSGSITYTRIEFAGYEVSFGNELNALTLNGVGAGTTIHHVQTNVGLDDGIELFGGTVDIKYAIVTNASDDSFDYSTGWQGRGQFWIAQQNPDDADNGFEVDGNEDNYNATPLTNPMIYNVTLVGNGPGGIGGSKSDVGMLLRRGAAGKIYNAVVTGFGDFGLDVDNEETVTNGLELRNSILAANKAAFANDDIDDEAFFMTDGWHNHMVEDAMMMDAFNREAPDFTPMAGSPLLEHAATPPSDGFFTAVDFIGAAFPDGDKWWLGWTDFSER